MNPRVKSTFNFTPCTSKCDRHSIKNTRNIKSTFDFTPFLNLNTPKYDGYSIQNTRIPKGTDFYGKTFYIEMDGAITAFKILAWAKQKTLTSNCGLRFLIHTPKETKWVELSKGFFTSVNDLVKGVNHYEIPIEWIYDTFDDYSVSLAHLNMVKGGFGGDIYYELHQSYYYSTSQSRVESTYSKIQYFMGTPQGIFIGLAHREEHHKCSASEILANRFDGMEVVDFGEPIKVEITFEIPSTECVVRKLVLK